MKIINNTIWRTDQLRAILQACAERELEPRKRKAIIVTVDYTRGGSSSGCAFVGGRHATIRIQHPETKGRHGSTHINVGDDDPRPAVCRWGDGHGNEGKVVRVRQSWSPEKREGLVLRFASVACHEFAHLRGMEHLKMPGYYKWTGGWRDYVIWAKDMALEPKAPKRATKPAPDQKLAHVQRMLKLALTRAKRAQTIVRKWKTKERYYERQMAARKTGPAEGGQ